MSEARNQLAVALHYDRTGAPRVVAKGKGAIGAKIIEVAKAHDIPIEENEVPVFGLRLTRPARRSP
jgi:flagellar biosynthesis protein